MKRFFRLGYFLCIAAITFLAGCAIVPASSLKPTQTATLADTMTPVPTVTTRLTRTPGNSSTPQLTPTASPTQTPTTTPTPLLNILWRVAAKEITYWSTESQYFELDWQDNTSFSVFEFNGALQRVNAASGVVTTLATAMPEPDYYALRWQLTHSAHFRITCDENKNNIELSSWPDGQFISRAPISVYGCESVDWSPDETKASVVSESGQLYIWPTNGKAPWGVGRVMNSSVAVWAPDGFRLLAANWTDDTQVTGLGSFSIAYADGRPIRPVAAPIEIGNGWEPQMLRWLTNDTVLNTRQCSAVCGFHAYYDAQTGDYLIGSIRDGIYGELGQSDLLSPDSRWLMLDTFQNADNWEERYYFEGRALVLYDLKRHQKHIWLQGDDTILFSAWSVDSQQFYFVRYPSSAQAADTSNGLFVMDRDTFETRLLIPGVLSTNWSPDRNVVLAVIAAKITDGQADELQGALYTREGERITPLQLLADAVTYHHLDNDLFPIVWSHNGERAALLDGLGNLWLFDSSGHLTQLASGLSQAEWPDKTVLNWSPNDSRLFVYRYGRAWIVPVD